VDTSAVIFTMRPAACLPHPVKNLPQLPADFRRLLVIRRFIANDA
jgi:hypothetical protein